MFELILNILLFLFFGYAFFFHVLEANVPVKVRNNPFALQPDMWPKAIIILLEICLLINIVKIIVKNKGKEDFTIKYFLKQVPGFFKSRMFFGIVILVVASFILEPLGFVVTCLLVLFSYGALLGQRKWLQLAIVSVVVSLLLFLIFNGLLSVNLPRGTVPFLRNFSLLLESLIQKVKNLF